MEDTVAMGLQHLGVDVKARVAKLGDLLRKEFHPVNRIAENDGLVDLQLHKTMGGR